MGTTLPFFAALAVAVALALAQALGAQAQLYGAGYATHSVLNHISYSNSLFEISSAGLMTSIASYTTALSELQVAALAVDPLTLNTYALLTGVESLVALVNIEVGFVTNVPLNVSVVGLAWEPVTRALVLLSMSAESSGAVTIGFWGLAPTTHALSLIAQSSVETARAPLTLAVSADSRGNVTAVFHTAEGALALWTLNAVSRTASPPLVSGSPLPYVPLWLVYRSAATSFFCFVSEANTSSYYFANFYPADGSFELVGAKSPISLAGSAAALLDADTVAAVAGNILVTVDTSTGIVEAMTPLSEPKEFLASLATGAQTAS